MIDRNLSYYLCNGVEFDSKVNACIYAQTVNKPLEWIFHNDAYRRYLWDIEPEETLDELYNQRCRQLREEYDYLILSYSGGSDTHNILESFIRQGLHIDEIVVNHISSATKNHTVLDPKVQVSWNFAAEHELQVVPMLNYIKNKLPKTKITVLDVSDTVLNSMQGFDDVEWVLDRNDYLSIGQLFRYNYFHFKEMKNKFDQGQKIAIIVGVDKPKCWISSDNKFYVSFNDSTANIVSIFTFKNEFTNIKNVPFYWAHDTAKLVCKQAHAIKHWLEANPHLQKYWYMPNTTVVRKVHEKLLRNVLYTTWNDNWFQTEKGTSFWNSEFDTWFHKEKSLEREYTQWKRGLEYLAKKIPDYVTYKNGMIDGLKMYKHSYYIGDMTTDIFRKT